MLKESNLNIGHTICRISLSGMKKDFSLSLVVEFDGLAFFKVFKMFNKDCLDLSLMSNADGIV